MGARSAGGENYDGTGTRRKSLSGRHGARYRFFLPPIPFVIQNLQRTDSAGLPFFRRLAHARALRAPQLAMAAVLAVGLFLASGCANVPDTRFLTLRHRRQAAEFKSAWGPIPARTSAAILARLKKKTGDVDILDRQVVLEQAIAHRPLVVGNQVTLLEDGPATYRAMFAAMQHAKKNINIESYIIGDGKVGRAFAKLLLERHAAGVQVNIIYDSFGAITTPRSFFDHLRNAGINVVEFNPINPLFARWGWHVNHRDHRKLMVVDGRTAFLGGINIDDDYASAPTSGGSGPSRGGGGLFGSTHKKNDPLHSGWRDTDIEIDGPVVADFQKLFFGTWEKQHGPPLQGGDYFPLIPPAGKEIVRAIGTSPDDAYSTMYMTLMAAITNAQKQIYITNAYFVPDAQLVNALIAAAHRGVDVRLILPSTTDSRSAAYAAHSHYTKLLKGGVRIYERRGALLHAKTAVIDGVWSCVGSSNLDWRSAVDNDEINAVVLSREFAEQMLAAFHRDLALSDEITLAHWRHRGFGERVKEQFFAMIGRLL